MGYNAGVPQKEDVMTDAPERIWAVPLEIHGSILVGGWADTIRQCPNGTEYVRADLAFPLDAAEARKPTLAEAAGVQSIGFDLGRPGGDESCIVIRNPAPETIAALRAIAGGDA